MYELFGHTADLGLRARAASVEELLAEAAKALFAAIVADLHSIEPREQRSFTIAGRELDYLLFDWLSELLYAFDSEHWLFCQFNVKQTDQGLEAVAHGEPMDPARHQLEHEVKAITYHGLRVVKENGQWLAEVIVDI